MSSSTSYQTTTEYPSLLWVAIPSVLLISAYFANNYYKSYRLKKYGIGKGAPGFQTNVKRLRVTPEIAARLQRGEQVSPEEIAAAVAKADEESSKRPPIRDIVEVGFGPRETTESSKVKDEPVNEWLPESITNPKKRVGKGKRR